MLNSNSSILKSGTIQLAFVALCPGIACVGQTNSATASGKLLSARTSPGYGALPLVFEANHGQTDAEVHYLAHGDGYSLFLTDIEAVLTLRARRDQTAKHDVVRMRLGGTAPSPAAIPEMTGEGELTGRVNDLIGADPQEWKSNLPTFSKVRRAGVYPGIDLVYYGNQRQLE